MIIKINNYFVTPKIVSIQYTKDKILYIRFHYSRKTFEVFEYYRFHKLQGTRDYKNSKFLIVGLITYYVWCVIILFFHVQISIVICNQWLYYIIIIVGAMWHIYSHAFYIPV